jgi:dihydrofolate reductase
VLEPNGDLHARFVARHLRERSSRLSRTGPPFVQRRRVVEKVRARVDQSGTSFVIPAKETLVIMLTTTTFVTLDGIMQAPGGPPEDRSGNFPHGGWLVPHFDQKLGEFMGTVFDRADAFLLGRGTYELFASHWPRVTDPKDPIASRLNQLPKHVTSKTRDRLDWKNSSVVRDVATEVPALVRSYDRELQVHGSAGLLQTLLSLGLVDRMHVIVFPLTLGTGKRLFGSGTLPSAFRLLSSESTPSGVVIATYERSGSPTYGSFMLAG